MARDEVIDVTVLTTADLPASFRVDPDAFARHRAALAAGLTLNRSACRCSPRREDCPACLTATLDALA